MTGLYVGQAVGGFGATLAAMFSWHAAFHWFGIIGIVYSLVLLLFLKENPKHGQKAVLEGETKLSKNPFRGLVYCLLDVGFLGNTLLFCRAKSPRLGNKELVANAIC